MGKKKMPKPKITIPPSPDIGEKEFQEGEEKERKRALMMKGRPGQIFSASTMGGVQSTPKPLLG